MCCHSPAEHDLAAPTLEDDGAEGAGDHGDDTTDLHPAESEVLVEAVSTVDIGDPRTITGVEFSQLHARCSSGKELNVRLI
ncbi:hypothetical protein J2129_000950 [Methanofollis sp. W23]|nr:hypothetical protein [Methanofollis sp. W23]